MTKIKAMDNGPFLVSDVTLVDDEGHEFDLSGWDVIALCRCGSSRKKPFCDGSHYKARFVAQERALQEG